MAYLFDTAQGKWTLANGIWRDNSGNGNTLADASASGVTKVAGHRSTTNAAANFPGGTNNYLSIADASQVGLDMTGSMSFSAWLYPKAIGAGLYHVFIAKADASGTYNYDAFINPSGYLVFRISSNGTSFTSCTGGTILTVNNWYHVAGVYNGTDIRLYLNNALDSSATNPQTYSAGGYNGTAVFRIGSGASGGNLFNGYIQDVVLWNSALTSGDVSVLYNFHDYLLPQGSVSGVIKDKNGNVINCTTYNVRVNVYPLNNTLNAPLSSQLVTAANGAWSAGGLVQYQKYSTTFEFEGSYPPTGEIDITTQELLLAV